MNMVEPKDSATEVLNSTVSPWRIVEDSDGSILVDLGYRRELSPSIEYFVERLDKDDGIQCPESIHQAFQEVPFQGALTVLSYALDDSSKHFPFKKEMRGVWRFEFVNGERVVHTVGLEGKRISFVEALGVLCVKQMKKLDVYNCLSGRGSFIDGPVFNYKRKSEYSDITPLYELLLDSYAMRSSLRNMNEVLEVLKYCDGFVAAGMGRKALGTHSIVDVARLASDLGIEKRELFFRKFKRNLYKGV